MTVVRAVRTRLLLTVLSPSRSPRWSRRSASTPLVTVDAHAPIHAEAARRLGAQPDSGRAGRSNRSSADRSGRRQPRLGLRRARARSRRPVRARGHAAGGRGRMALVPPSTPPDMPSRRGREPVSSLAGGGRAVAASGRWSPASRMAPYDHPDLTAHGGARRLGGARPARDWSRVDRAHGWWLISRALRTCRADDGPRRRGWSERDLDRRFSTRPAPTIGSTQLAFHARPAARPPRGQPPTTSKRLSAEPVTRAAYAPGQGDGRGRARPAAAP